MDTIERIPEAELDVMLTLWHSPSPLTVGEIAKILADTHGWKTPTIHVLLDRLGERGFVSCDRSGYKHLFAPLITEADYRRGEEHTLMTRFFGGSAKNLIASLLDADDLSEEDLDELGRMLKERRTGGRK